MTVKKLMNFVAVGINNSFDTRIILDGALGKQSETVTARMVLPACGKFRRLHCMCMCCVERLLAALTYPPDNDWIKSVSVVWIRADY